MVFARSDFVSVQHPVSAIEPSMTTSKTNGIVIVISGNFGLTCGKKAARRELCRIIRRLGSEITTESGVPAEKIEQVFERFFTTKKEGMGLGLSICRSIIDAHEGKIWATNNADCGATFYFSLPVDRQERRQ